MLSLNGILCMNMTKNKKISKGKIVALGAAAYYFLGPKGKEHQQSAQKWLVEAKKKIIKKIEKEKIVTKEAYEKIVDNVLHSYEVAGISLAEVVKSAKSLKDDWKHIAKETKTKAKNTVKNITTEVKKTKN